MPHIITSLNVFFVRLLFVSFSFIYIFSLTFFFQSPMQVDNTGGPPAPDTLPPMPPPNSSAPAVGAIPIFHFLISLFSRSSLLFLTLIYFLSLLLHLCPLLALTVVLLRKIYFSFFSLFFFFNLSFYSSRYLPCYLGLLQTKYSYSELHAPLLFSPHYQDCPYLCLIQCSLDYLLPGEYSLQLQRCY